MKISTKSRWIGGVMALTLIGAACSSGSGGDAESADDSPAAAESSGDSSGSTNGAPEALQFTAPLVGGGEIDLAAGFDNKPTLFWFWAPD